jgi:tripartite-type tricarboxylate transporter receptor subunit TctC
MRSLLCTVALAALCGAAGNAIAQVYPSRPITLIVPSPAGGTADVLGHILAEHMTTSLGQPVLIENVHDAEDTLGVFRIARAAPDGYTLGIVGNSSAYASNGTVYSGLWYNFRPVALLPSVPTWIVARNAIPATNLKELTAWLKANPGNASAGIVGSGTPGHVCDIFLQDATGTRFQVVPYWGGAAMLKGLVHGQIDFICDQPQDSLAMVRSGQIKAYAVMARTRWFAMPDIPTADEMGVPGIYVSYWHGLWVAKGTPNDIIAKLNTAAVDAMADATVRRRIADQNMEIPLHDQQTPEALGTFQRAEIPKWCEATGKLWTTLPLCFSRRADAN